MTGLADTGRVIAGRYRLQAPIGRGAMGVVWRARDELLDRDVAVKEVQVAETLTEEERANAYQRTLREAKTAARLSHPAVVSVFDVASEDGRPWIVMELINSQSLDQVLAASGPMPARAVAELGRQLLSALTVAHAAGVLHRDVKPSNVLLAGDGRAVLTDFGIATFQGDPKLTATGMVMGSPGFTAPERIRGGDATPASDLWSLGATLYAAVEGRGPYEARGGAFTTMSAVINEDAPAASSAGALEPVIASLLRRDPAERPDAVTATRMISDVLPLLPDRGAGGGGYQPTALAARPAAPRPETARPEAARPEAARPEAARPEMTEASAPAGPVPTMRQSGGEPAPPDFSSWYSSSLSSERSGSAWSAYQSGPPAGPAVPPRQGAPSPSRATSDYGGGYGPSPRGGSGARWVLVLVILALLGAGAGVAAVVLLRHNTSGSPGTSGSTPPVSSSGPASSPGG
ncbi:MAG TPA: serine/threonine-protein kinase, partial [Streptosporangiaceae bacterium]|nr:serine/threonine-protein kinase [Streptosporangiaceae bacterium]